MTLAFLCLLCGGPLTGNATPPEKFPGSMIALPSAEMPLDEVLTELRKSGNRIEFSNFRGDVQPNPLVKVPTTRTLFWPLLDQLAQQEKLGLTVEGRTLMAEPRLRISRLASTARPAAPPTVYAGPFRLVLREASRHRRFDQQASAKLQLGLELSWEPRIDPLFLQVEALSATAGDNKLAAPLVAGQLRLHGLGQLAWTEQFSLPAQSPAWIEELSGTLAIRVPARSEVLTSEARRGATAEKGGIRLEVLGLESSGRNSILRMQLRYPAGQFELESHQAWAFADQRIDLAATKEGPPLVGKGTPHEVSVMGGGEVRLTYLIPGEPASLPAFLRLSIPADPISVRFPFTFQRVPLP